MFFFKKLLKNVFFVNLNKLKLWKIIVFLFEKYKKLKMMKIKILFYNYWFTLNCSYIINFLKKSNNSHVGFKNEENIYTI